MQIDLSIWIKSNKNLLIYRLDLGFLPKELLYNEKTTYCESTINLIAAIEILEKAQHTKNNSNVKKDLPENKSFWSMINLFKCGGYN